MNQQKGKNNKFIITPPSIWVEAPSNQEIIDLIANYPIPKNKREDGWRIKTCYLNKRILCASSDKNEDYNFFIYSLDLSEDLQAAATQDFVLSKHQIIIFHRIGVIR